MDPNRAATLDSSGVNGGQEALEACLEELAPLVFRYTAGTTADPGLAEEAAQDALSALVQRWRGPGPPDSPRAFVFTIARRRLRRQLWRRRLSLPLDAVLGHRDPAPDAHHLAEQRRRLAAALRGLGELRPGEREALLLVAISGLTAREAAEIQGVSLSAVKMRLHRARRKLAELPGRR